MKFIHPIDVEGLPVDHTFRAPPAGMLILPIVLAAIASGMAWALLNQHLPKVLWAGVAVLFLLIPFVIRTNFLPSLKPTNWVLKIQGDQLLIMLRNFRNPHSVDDEPIVFQIATTDIQSVGEQTRRVSMPSNEGGRTVWKERRLEFRLHRSVPEQFRKALDAERRRRPPAVGMVRQKYYHPSPVSCDEQTIRILWNGRSEVVTPSLSKALAVLSTMIQRHETLASESVSADCMTDAELDDLIIQLCLSGARIEAIRILQREKGYTLTKATRFVDELMSA